MIFFVEVSEPYRQPETKVPSTSTANPTTNTSEVSANVTEASVSDGGVKPLVLLTAGGATFLTALLAAGSIMLGILLKRKKKNVQETKPAVDS